MRTLHLFLSVVKQECLYLTFIGFFGFLWYLYFNPGVVFGLKYKVKSAFCLFVVSLHAMIVSVCYLVCDMLFGGLELFLCDSVVCGCTYYICVLYLVMCYWQVKVMCCVWFGVNLEMLHRCG